MKFSLVQTYYLVINVDRREMREAIVRYMILFVLLCLSGCASVCFKELCGGTGVLTRYGYIDPLAIPCLAHDITTYFTAPKQQRTDPTILRKFTLSDEIKSDLKHNQKFLNFLVETERRFVNEDNGEIQINQMPAVSVKYPYEPLKKVIVITVLEKDKNHYLISYDKPSTPVASPPQVATTDITRADGVVGQ